MLTPSGTSILVSGLTGTDLGSYTATLDGAAIATLNAGNNVTTHGTVLFFATNLETSKTHTLELTSGDGGLVLDSWTAYGPQGGVGFM